MASLHKDKNFHPKVSGVISVNHWGVSVIIGGLSLCRLLFLQQ